MLTGALLGLNALIIIKILLRLRIIINCNKISLGDLATWAGAIGTFLAFFAVILQIRDERIIRKKTENAERERLHREQAEHISAWVDNEDWQNRGPIAQIAVLNQSKEPIYQVIVSIVAFQGAGPSSGIETQDEFLGFLSIIPPKSKVTVEVNGGYHGMSFHPAVEVAFIDRNGQTWIRKGNGDLMQINHDPTDYYHLPRPLSWQLPKTSTSIA